MNGAKKDDGLGYICLPLLPGNSSPVREKSSGFVVQNSDRGALLAARNNNGKFYSGRLRHELHEGRIYYIELVIFDHDRSPWILICYTICN